MADTRGMATQILRDMLNIGIARRTNPVEGDNDGAAASEEKEVVSEDSASDSTSVSSSAPSPPRNQLSRASDLASSDGYVTSSNESSTVKLSLEPVKQVVKLSEGDDTVSIYGNQVEIVASEASLLTTSATSSSKIKINPIVKYDWEPNYYYGNLIAYGKKFIAYTLKGNSGYVIRLLNPLTANRALIKGFTGMITDLAFAHRNSNTLACVDEGGTLYIWNVAEEDSKIQYTVKLIVEREDKELSEYHRVFWCSYLPDESEEEEASNNGTREDSNGSIAVTHDNQAEVYDLDVISTEILGKKVSIEEVRQSECYLSIKDGHTKPITDGALSPDGCVLTTASEDGSVKFWQLSDTPSDGSPSSVYCFQPHDGAPVSCLLFCDNHLVQDKEIPMWRFMITGTNYNRELKIWCTVTWNCLQTISFTVPVGLQVSPDVQEEPCIKISMDLTASYLVLSDIKRKALCVLMLHQDAEEGRAHVTSLSEFLLTQPLLSFVIAKAKFVKQHSNGEQLETENLDDSDEYDDEIMNDDSELSKNFGVQLRLYCIHTKSMQELLVHFHPEPSVPPATPSSVSSLMNSEVAGIRDGLSDLSGVETEASSTDVEEQEAVPAVGVSTARLKLITPDAFTQTLNKRGTRPDTAISVSSSVTTVTSVNNSHPSIDDRSASSISSNLSDSTLKSSIQETPRSSFSVENGRSMSPTSLPLPMTPTVDEVKTPISLPLPKASPVQLAPDPSAIPMPAFQSTPFCPGPDAETEKEAKLRAKQVEFPEAQEEEVSPAAVERSSPFSGNEKDVEVETEDSPKEDHLQGASLSQEDLPAQEKDRSRPHSRELTPTPLDERPLISLTEDDTRDVEPEQDERIEINILQESVQPSDVELLERASLNYFTSAPLSSPPFDRVSKRELKEQNLSLVTSPQSTINIEPEQTTIPEVNTSLQATLDQILSIVQSQQQEIMDLKQQLRQQQTFQNQAVVRMLHEEMKRIESVVTTRVQTALADHAKEENQRLEKALRERHQADKKKQEQLQNTVSQSVTTAVAGKVEKAVKGEMKNSVVPAVQKLLTPVQEQMNVTITQKLTAADTVLKDSIGKMVRSKPVIEAIGAATVNALQGPIQAGYRETFQNIILPSFEKATQSMFQQINDSFQRGTQHYLQQVSGSLNQLSKEQKDARDPIVQQLQSQVNEFQVASEQLSSQMEMNVESAMQNVLQSQFPSILRSHREELLRKLREETLHTIQDTLGRDMREILMEHTQHLSELSSLDRSRQRDPMQQQMEITRLIEGGLPAEAFKEALTAEDLQLVVYVCQNVDPGELFSQDPLPLAQPILLSLIQQLSVDLSSDTEIKYSYLQEALMALDSKDEVTREHLPTVLLGLKQQLTSTAKESTGQLGKMSRMLLMLAESLMK